MSDEPTELTLEKLLSVMKQFPPAPPPFPKWKDLTWPQRNMIEREIQATESSLIRDAMRDAFYCEKDDCKYHPSMPATEETVVPMPPSAGGCHGGNCGLCYVCDPDGWAKRAAQAAEAASDD